MIFVIVAEAGSGGGADAESCAAFRHGLSIPSAPLSGPQSAFGVPAGIFCQSTAGRGSSWSRKADACKIESIHIHSRTRVHVFFNFCLIIF